ncbi:MAG: DUF3616 domain-containing protein, partial [Actinobacteria bacterium]|nr:DUF3616 domain-containing protein [Actinomycetota bacterium]
ATVERLTAVDGAYQAHVTFPLGKVIALPGGPQDEVDVEGLARQGPYLWAVGSHSSRRKRIKDKHDDEKSVRRLARVSTEPSRHVVARLAVTEDTDGLPSLVAEAPGGHTSAILPGGISAVLDDDEHLAPFLAIPGKDNGFDVEGVAVHGDSLYLGLRGPVLRGWAVLLEVQPIDAAQARRLELATLDDGALYRKHFLDIDGLGVRDLFPDGDDLLVLAGPSMDLDGVGGEAQWNLGLGGHGSTLALLSVTVASNPVPAGRTTRTGRRGRRQQRCGCVGYVRRLCTGAPGRSGYPRPTRRRAPSPLRTSRLGHRG